MKFRYMALLAVVALLVTAVSYPTTQTAFAQTGPNLLANPSFEEGHYNQDGISELTMPNGWRLNFLDGVGFAGSNGEAYRPETVVWNIIDAPPHERNVFWRDGSYNLKIFKSWSPVYAAISQDVTGLEVGRRYQFAVPVYIDIVAEYDGGKVAPDKLDSGMVRLGAGPVGAAWRDGNTINYSGWWTAETISPFYLAYPVFIHEFTATHDTMTVWVEVASKDPYPNNGFFLDGLSLRAMGGAAAPPPAAPPPSDGGAQQPAAPAAQLPPVPTIEPRADGSVVHTVQSGDTLWGLAIRYASPLDMTAEEALDQINSLNNSPAFLTVGQELLIMPAGTMSAAAEEEDEADDEPDEVEDEADEEVDEEEMEAAEEETAVSAANNTICVLAFHDQNASGEQDAGDAVLADAALTLTRDGATVATAVSDEAADGHCFEGLEEGTYTVQFYPPAGFVPTTAPSWAVAVDDNSRVAVRFGAQRETAVAAVDTVDDSPDQAESDTPPVESAMVIDDGGGFMSNLGTIVIGIAVFLIILAGAGIFLLRRG